MKIRYLTALGHRKGPATQPGTEAEVAKDEAERLVAKGFAEPVKSTKRETTTSKKAKAAETRDSSAVDEE